MSEWREQEWRLPRRGDIVVDSDGNLGKVNRSEGTLRKRTLWIENLNGLIIHSNEEAELFTIADSEKAQDFNLKQHEALGYKVGAICCYKGDMNIPLEIIQVNWNILRYKLTVYLKDMREFNGEIMITEDIGLIPIIDLNLPPKETIFSNIDSGLKVTFEINLVDSTNLGWSNCGSPFEFDNSNIAMNEFYAWKSRLVIRRVSSVLNADWKIKFPCWCLESFKKDDKILVRVKETNIYTGSPGYFRSGLIAAHALKMIPEEDIERSFYFSKDTLNL